MSNVIEVFLSLSILFCLFCSLSCSLLHVSLLPKDSLALIAISHLRTYFHAVAHQNNIPSLHVKTLDCCSVLFYVLHYVVLVLLLLLWNINSSIHPFTNQPIHPSVHPSTHPSINPSIHPSILSPTHSPTYQATHSLTHSVTHPLAQPFTHFVLPSTYLSLHPFTP